MAVSGALFPGVHGRSPQALENIRTNDSQSMADGFPVDETLPMGHEVGTVMTWLLEVGHFCHFDASFNASHVDVPMDAATAVDVVGFCAVEC